MDELSFVGVMAGWFLFGLSLLLRKRPLRARADRRDWRSLFGMALQGIGFGVVWGFRRSPGTPLFGRGGGVDVLSASMALLLMAASTVFVHLAIQTLGRHWSLAARIVERHELVTAGPFAVVRHPIYSGMLGMLVATGLAVSRSPAAILGGVLAYVAGTLLRTRVEERLLRATFGDAYEAYARRVPALLPRWPRHLTPARPG